MMLYASGADIEVLDGNGKWVKCNDPAFEWSRHQYRLAVPVAYAPFDNQEECVAESKKHKPFGLLKSKMNEGYRLVRGIDSETIELDNIGIIYRLAFEQYTYADGLPFGKRK